MLDKSIEYKHIIMKLPIGEYKPLEAILPKGYRFKFYESGDRNSWAEVETSVLEFDSEEKALEYFDREFLPYEDELYKRMIFIINPDGEAVATATAWYKNAERKGRYAKVHWVAVKPEYQGLGLGKAVMRKCLETLSSVGPYTDIYLHAQTWSHKAVRLYHALGFRMVKRASAYSKLLFDGNNDYRQALKILRTVIDKKLIDELILNSTR